MKNNSKKIKLKKHEEFLPKAKMQVIISQLTVVASIFFSFSNVVNAEQIRVLFIGNSYTHMNNFPEIVANIGAEKGDMIYSDYSAIDNYTLEKHFSHSQTIEKIKEGCWDYVILQEQSQRPVMDSATFHDKTEHYANELTNLIYAYNPSAQPILFLTWGRKLGDKELCKRFKWTCSYKEMQQMLIHRYNLLGSKLALPVAPCGIAWEHFAPNSPFHIDLFYSDNKHPNKVGSFLNACIFYTVITGKTSVGIKYNPANLNAKELYEIQTIAYKTVKKYLPTFLRQ